MLWRLERRRSMRGVQRDDLPKSSLEKTALKIKERDSSSAVRLTRGRQFRTLGQHSPPWGAIWSRCHDPPGLAQVRNRLHRAPRSKEPLNPRGHRGFRCRRQGEQHQRQLHLGDGDHGIGDVLRWGRNEAQRQNNQAHHAHRRGHSLRRSDRSDAFLTATTRGFLIHQS